ncbi:MAG: nucleoside monophosphate kinase [Patescibacteria group bacterium]|nr:nucleoside monophosphate kinase [Patescibacteria group bacterium]
MPQILNLAILGPPGAGKGTQANLLEKKFKLAHIETGDILRERAQKKDKLGREIQQTMLEGKLVSSDLLMKTIDKYIKKISKKKGILLDGTPRKLSQAKDLDKLFKKHQRELSKFIFLDIDQKTSVKRLLKRRVCLKCDKSFILGQTLKKTAKNCPICGGKIFQRPDDNPASLKKRWQVFSRETRPVMAYFKKQNKLILINGEQTIKEVHQNIIKQLKT